MFRTTVDGAKEHFKARILNKGEKQERKKKKKNNENNRREPKFGELLENLLASITSTARAQMQH
jgi:hypothetical protein